MRLAPLAIIFALLATGAAATSRIDRVVDLEITRSQYVLKSKAFTPSSRRAALALIDRLERKAGALRDAEFLIGTMEIAALAQNGHDAVDFGPGAWVPPTRLPFRMIWFPDGIVVARAGPQQSDLLGARVMRVEGLTPAELLDRLRSLCGGTDTYRKWDLMWFVENGGLLHTLGVARDPDRLRFRFLLPDGREVSRTIAFVTKASLPGGAEPGRYWSPAPIDSEREKGWRTATDELPVPLYLGDADTLYRIVRMPELHALYIQFRANWDENGQFIKPFAQHVLEEIENRQPENVILDLRFDVGGDIDATKDLMRAVATVTPGRVFLLVGRYTFSAGIAAAAIVRHEGRRVTVVGEALGDRLRWWSEIDVTCLPRSHLCLRGTHGLWDLEKGCKGEPGCYGDRYDAVVGSLRPDIFAPLTAAAWLSGHDPGMEAVETELRTVSDEQLPPEERTIASP
ncbi:MAG TPA: hypothetical protein VMU22_00885 [Rhizomicrobium sp.]|nr:hypothetical protein [Rhizomicrobium sp.]